MEKMLPEKKIHDYFGIDIGDGETAVAWARQGQKTEPQMLEIRGRKNLLTALGVDASGARHIGEEAFQIMNMQSLSLRFKSRFLEEGGARRTMADFALTLRENLREYIPDSGAAKCYIGCPSGWDEKLRAEYLALLQKAGFENAQIISESRAALVFAQESGELRISGDILHKPALIIDAGSSTTDFTYIENMREQRLSDEGEIHLGAGLLDALLLSYNIEDQPDLLEVFAEYPPLKARCELEARKVKEMYFTAKQRGTGSVYPFESSIKLYTDPPRRVDIRCDEAIMEKLLHTPLAALGGAHYLSAYTQSLRDIRAKMHTPPEVLLLTGGASRMPFMREIAEKAFPDASIIQGKEPEFAIARGLCYALRMEEKRAAFLQDIESMIASDAVENAVSAELKTLFRSLSPVIVDAISGDVAPDVFARWRDGSIVTLEDMTRIMAEESGAYMQGETLAAQLRPVIAHWLNALRPKLEDITNPICDRYDLPRASLMLPDFMQIPAEMPLDAESVFDLSTLKFLVDIIIASIVAMLAGGGGTALILGGPLGLVIGFIIGLVAAWFGTQYAEKLLLRRNIPHMLRKPFSRKFFAQRLQSRREDMIAQMNAQLLAKVEDMTPDIQNMVDTIAQSIEKQLYAEMEKAILLIR